MLNKKNGILIITLIVLIAACQRPLGNERGILGEGEEVEIVEMGEPFDSDNLLGSKEQTFAIITTPVQEGVLVEYMELSGNVRSTSSVEVLAETGGKLTRIFVDVGDRVGRNALLVRIDPSRPGQRFESNNITSPIAGTVIALPLRVGAQVSPGVPVARVAKIDELEIVTNIAERFISRAAVGQKATVTFDAYPGEVFSAQVASISPVLDERSRTLELKLRVQDPDRKLRSGMFASLQLILKRKLNVLQIPSDAVMHRFGKELVYVLDVGRTSVEERVVRTGLEIDEKVEILEGLNSGEEVIYQGQTFLTDGAKVQVIDTVSPIIFEE